MLDVEKLKRRFRAARSVSADPAWWDAYPLPLSTGSPLFDAAGLDPLQLFAGLSRTEILARLWTHVKDATAEDLAFLEARKARVCRDLRLLVATRHFADGDVEKLSAILDGLPAKDRASFLVVLCKPADVFLRGRQRSATFRFLTKEHDLEPLRKMLGSLMDGISDRDVLLARHRLKQAAAMLHFRPTNDRQKGIHQFLFGGGPFPREAGLLRTYHRACRFIREGNWPGFLGVLEEESERLPLSTFEGILGGLRLGLSRPDTPPGARRYALRAATWTEFFQRLRPWSAWLDRGYVPYLESKLTDPGGWADGSEARLLPTLLQAWLLAPAAMHRLLNRPVFVPLLRRFSQYVASRLPGSKRVLLLQGGYPLERLDTLFFALLRQHRPTSLQVALRDGHARLDDLDLSEACPCVDWGAWRYAFFLWKRFGARIPAQPLSFLPRNLTAKLEGADGEDVVVTITPTLRDLDLAKSLSSSGLIISLEGSIGLPQELSLKKFPILLAGGHPSRGHRSHPDLSSTINSSWLALPEALDVLSKMSDMAEEVHFEA